MSKGLLEKAKTANGRSRMCAKCKFLNRCTPDISWVCRNSFLEGYTKGYKQRRSEEKK